MLHSNVSKNQGFTLIESLIVVSITGILLAIGIPSLLAAQNRAKLGQATDLVIASLQEAQGESMRHSQGCTLTLDRINNKIYGLSGCLVSGDRFLPDAISLNYTGAANTIEYGIRGNTTSNKTIVLKIKDSSTNARCLTISAPLGIIRVGSYNPNTFVCEKLVN